MRLSPLLFVQLILTFCGLGQHSVVESWSLHRIMHHDRNQFRIVSKGASTFRTPKSFTLTSANKDDSITDEQKVLPIDSLSPSQIVELIELSFLQACVAMAQRDTEPLKLFIVAVKAAKDTHDKNILELIKEVNDCPTQTAGRPLDTEEQELRSTWIQAIYLMLSHVNKENAMDVDKDVMDTYGPFLEDLVSIHKSGLGLNIERFVASRKDVLLAPPTVATANNPLLLEDEQEDDDPVQLAIVTQTIKVLYNTLQVLDELEGGNTSTDSEETETKKKAKKKKKASGGKGFA